MENIKKSNFLKPFVDGIFYKNPVLSLFMGLTLAVIATSRVEIAVVISFVVLVDLILSNFFISLFRKHLTRISSYILDTIISAGVATIACILIDRLAPGLMNATEAKYSIVLFLVIPFVATNSVAIAKCKDDLDRSLVETLGDALGSAIGFGLVLVIISLIREILSSGAITIIGFHGGVHKGVLWDSSKFSINLMANPFGGLLCVGLFSGIHLTVVKFLENKRKEKEEVK